MTEESNIFWLVTSSSIRSTIVVNQLNGNFIKSSHSTAPAKPVIFEYKKRPQENIAVQN